MIKISLKGMWGHKRRMIGTVLAVVLGVGFLSGTLMLGDTMRGGFGDAFAEANEGIDAIVRNPEELDAGDGASQRAWVTDASAEVERLSAVDGVDVALPRIEGAAQIVAADGDPLGGNGPPTSAAAWLDDPRLESYEIAEGRAPEAEGEVVIDALSAEDGDLAVGDETTILTPEPVPVTIVGTVTIGGEDALGSVTYVGLVPSQAEALFAPGPDQASGIVIAADEGVSQVELADAIAPTLPDGLEVLTGDELTAEQKSDVEGDFLGFFTTLLNVFALIALLVAAFSIANTFAIITAQRTRESALLRALGASRRQILLSTTIEAFVLGLIASVLGLAAGIGLAALATAGVGALGFPKSDLVIDSGTVIVSLLVGLVVTVGASILPAVRASRVPPIAALREVAIDDVKALRVRFAVGSVLTLLGVAGVLYGVVNAGEDGAANIVGFGSFATLAGVIALGPVVARPAARFLALPLPFVKGTTGRLARENASRNPRRTASTALALLVGVTVVAVFTILGASINASIQESVDKSFASDLVVFSQSFSGTGLDPQMAADIDALDDVDALGFGGAALEAEGEPLLPDVTDPSRIDEFIEIDVVDGDLGDVAEGSVAIDEDMAEDQGWALGDTVTVTYLDGATDDLTVDAVYEPNDFLSGGMIMTPETWNPHAPQAADFFVLVDAAEGVSVDEAKAAVEPITEEYAAPDPLDRDEYLDLVAGEIQQALTIVYALLILAIIIALMGIANTLSLSVYERTRELGLLRAVGQSRRQLRSMVRWESVVIALFGTVGGLTLGSLLGWALYKTLAEAESGGGGAPTPFVLPVGQLITIMVLGALVGVVAAARPARRASKMNVLDAIAQS
jgi:putative ABC transport system permease protein